MLQWLRNSRKEPGWLSILLSAERLGYAHGRVVPGRHAVVTRLGVQETGAESGSTASRLLRELHVQRFQCTTLLDADEYQMLLVDAPNVPPAELKSAVRWKLKDMVDYPVAEATFDVLDIPAEDGARSRSMFAVSARNTLIEARMKAFEAAGIPLAVIEVPETAQRNIAALYEEEGRGLAFLHLGPDTGLLTITSGGELYLARRMEVGFDALRNADGAARETLFTRIVVELQRTFDHFERQFRFVAVGSLVLGPLPEETGLQKHLAENLALRVETADLSARIDFASGAAPGPALQWQLLHLIGAALRNEAKAH